MVRINRYIMECKCNLDRFSLWHQFELIDTLWNVNVLKDWNKEHGKRELIDTLWNVNCVYNR